MKTIIIILTILSFTICGSGNAQSCLYDLKLDSSTLITAIGETSRFCWVGTNNGLYRIHKSSCKTWVMTVRKSALPHNYVTSIACSADGRVYIGTKSGILFFDGSGFIAITDENSNLPDYYVTALSFDQAGDLWIATYNAGLLKGIGKDIKPFKIYGAINDIDSQMDFNLAAKRLSDDK